MSVGIRGLYFKVQISLIVIIANFVFTYICSFFLYLHYMMLVNIKLDVNGCNRITFQGRILHWSSSFQMAKLKRSWHSCIAEMASSTHMTPPCYVGNFQCQKLTPIGQILTRCSHQQKQKLIKHEPNSK